MGAHGLLVPGMRRRDRYFQKVKGIAPANLILYQPLSELSGSVATDYSGQGNHGAYTGVTLGQPGIGDGRTCPLFDGTNDVLDLHNGGSLNADLNKAEGSLWGWVKVGGAGVWTDATIRFLAILRADVNNRIAINRTTTNNQLAFNYIAGGTAKTVLTSVLGGVTAFAWVGMTWSVAADEMKAYINGAQVGATQNGLGTWVNALASANTALGAGSTTPTNPWDGYLAHWGIHNAPLTAAQMLALATV